MTKPSIKLNTQGLFRRAAVWIITVALALVYIFTGFKLVSRNLDIFNMEGAYAVKAQVTEVGEYVSDSYTAGQSEYQSGTLYFFAEILTNKEFKGQKVLAAQTFDNYSNMSLDDPVKEGDKVILYNYGTPQGEADWVFGGVARLDGALWLGAVFVILLVVMGWMKGVNTVVSLALTCLAVFMVFVPSVLAGSNVYLMTALTCIFSIVTTLLITNGATAKSFTTILGCTFGVTMAAVLAVYFDKTLKLTGLLDEHSIYLKTMGNGVEVDLRALIFAMIVIGAMGAVMDVAMDISSSLNELHVNAPHMKFFDLFKSGMTIGRDVMGTMANTLVLAYIGSSLCSILIYITYSSSLFELMNRENIVVELLQALIGSMAILLTIPLTTLVCCFMYTGRGEEMLEKMGASVGGGSTAAKEWFDPVRNRSQAAGLSTRAKASDAPSRGVRKQTRIDMKEAQDPSRYYTRSIIPDKDPINFYADFEKKKDGDGDGQKPDI